MVWTEQWDLSRKKKQATSLKKCTSLRLDITIIRGLATAQTLLEKAPSAGGLYRNSWARLVASLRPCLYDSSGQKNSWIWVKQFCFKFQMKLFQLHYSSSKTKQQRLRMTLLTNFWTDKNVSAFRLHGTCGTVLVFINGKQYCSL